jgi:hypothetical protein
VLIVYQWLRSIIVQRDLYAGQKDWQFCSPSALDQLSHRLARHALAIGGAGVSLHFFERGVAGDRRDLVRGASDLGQPPRRRLDSRSDWVSGGYVPERTAERADRRADKTRENNSVGRPHGTSSHQLLNGDRKVAHPRAGGVIDGIGNRWRH